MTTDRLPNRISATMLCTISVFLLAIGVSVLWMTRALNIQAGAQSEQLVNVAVSNLTDLIGVTNLDNAKWSEAVDAVVRQDVPWLYNNIGISAQIGETMDLALIWGGPMPDELGWASGTTDPEPTTGLAGPLTRQTDARLAAIPFGEYRGITFFFRHQGRIYVAGASRIEMEGAAGSARTGAESARLLLAIEMTQKRLSTLASATFAENLSLVSVPVPGRAALALPGIDREPVAWLVWHQPAPGTVLLWQMMPALLLVVLSATALVLLATHLARRAATGLVRAERTARVLARTDALTGLANRSAFMEILAQSAPAGQRVVLFLDINGFKQINDSLGHFTGDTLIIRLAERLRLLADDDVFLARIGGDEFVFVLTGPRAIERVESLSQRAEAALIVPFLTMGHSLTISVAMGYAAQSDDFTTGDDLVHQADLAMYEAKRTNARSAVPFDAEVARQDRDDRAIAEALHHALAHPGELSVVYQPILTCQTGRFVRAEALARWQSPTLGPVPPDQFIRVAEKTGLITDLGRHLFSRICDDLVAWPDLQVSINISPLQLAAPNFIDDIIAVLARRGINPTRIEIELTEGVLVADTAQAAMRLQQLHAAGFVTALDDFGTGFSSIGALMQLPFHTVKIDRSFVMGLGQATDRLQLVGAMIQLGRALDLCVVCEGVETAEELDAVRALGADRVQGYLFDRPLPLEELVQRWLVPLALPLAATA